MKYAVILAIGLLALGAAGCPSGSTEINPFLTYSEQYLTGGTGGSNDGSGGGAAAQAIFRRTMQITLANNHPSAALNTSLLAWVNISSIRSAEQQDALINAGYVQLTRQTQIGDVYSLPPGTFVLHGAGYAGAVPVELPPAAAGGADNQVTASTFVLETITPDVVLVFLQPPVSCDSVAFEFSVDGKVLEGPSTSVGGYKTLSMVDVYDCNTFHPGLFLRTGGGARASNEYFEGDAIRFDFLQVPTQAGSFCQVTIGG